MPWGRFGRRGGRDNDDDFEGKQTSTASVDKSVMTALERLELQNSTTASSTSTYNRSVANKRKRACCTRFYIFLIFVALGLGVGLFAAFGGAEIVRRAWTVPDPTARPTRAPSVRPSAMPTGFPSVPPSYRPSRVPSRTPIARPSRAPSFQPTARPSVAPTLAPNVASGGNNATVTEQNDETEQQVPPGVESSNETEVQLPPGSGPTELPPESNSTETTPAPPREDDNVFENGVDRQNMKQDDESTGAADDSKEGAEGEASTASDITINGDAAESDGPEQQQTNPNSSTLVKDVDSVAGGGAAGGEGETDSPQQENGNLTEDGIGSQTPNDESNVNADGTGAMVKEDTACRGGKVLVNLHMYDNIGDGWGTAKLTVTKKSGVVVYKGSMSDGEASTEPLCLSTEACYNVVIDGSMWMNEISWEMKMPEREEAVAKGLAPVDCTFSLNGGAKCEHTCNSWVKKKPPFNVNASPTNAPPAAAPPTNPPPTAAPPTNPPPTAAPPTNPQPTPAPPTNRPPTPSPPTNPPPTNVPPTPAPPTQAPPTQLPATPAPLPTTQAPVPTTPAPLPTNPAQSTPAPSLAPVLTTPAPAPMLSNTDQQPTREPPIITGPFESQPTTASPTDVPTPDPTPIPTPSPTPSPTLSPTPKYFNFQEEFGSWYYVYGSFSYYSYSLSTDNRRQRRMAERKRARRLRMSKTRR